MRRQRGIKYMSRVTGITQGCSSGGGVVQIGIDRRDTLYFSVSQGPHRPVGMGSQCFYQRIADNSACTDNQRDISITHASFLLLSSSVIEWGLSVI